METNKRLPSTFIAQAAHFKPFQWSLHKIGSLSSFYLLSEYMHRCILVFEYFKYENKFFKCIPEKILNIRTTSYIPKNFLRCLASLEVNKILGSAWTVSRLWCAVTAAWFGNTISFTRPCSATSFSILMRLKWLAEHLGYFCWLMKCKIKKQNITRTCNLKLGLRISCHLPRFQTLQHVLLLSLVHSHTIK